MSQLKNNRGFIGIIVIIVIAIILLSYLGFDLKKIFMSDLVQKNFGYVWGFIKTLWLNYLSVPFTYLWNELLKPLFELSWKALKIGIQGIKAANSSTN